MIPREEIPHFRWDPSRDDPERYVRLTFRLETSEDPEWVAVNLCSEQSTAQWTTAGSGIDLRPRHAAKVVSWKILEESRKPLYPLPSTRGKEKFLRCEVTVAHPHENFGPRLSNFLTAAAGEGVFYVPEVHTIQLTAIDFPKAFLQEFEGPQFGLTGLRERLSVVGRPVFLGVVKPNLGLSPEQFASIAEKAWEGGIDVAKDDEMQADAAWSSLEERCRKTRKARERAEARTGKKKLYLVNVTDDGDRILELARLAVASGADMVMVNAMMVGLGMVRRLRQISEVPIMGHFAGVAVWGRLPFFGVHSSVLCRLMRLAGCDLVGLAGFGPRMQSELGEIRSGIEACLTPWRSIVSALPIPGGGDWAGTLPMVCEKIGHVDFGFICGRGIFAHPDGPAAGARSITQAWEAVSQGISLDEQAKSRPELRTALKTFSKR